MVSAHPLASLEAHFARSLEGPGSDCSMPLPVNHGDFVDKDNDYGRGLMLAFPAIWNRLSCHQRLKAIYIVACIDKGIEEPPVLREWMP